MANRYEVHRWIHCIASITADSEEEAETKSAILVTDSIEKSPLLRYPQDCAGTPMNDDVWMFGTRCSQEDFTNPVYEDGVRVRKLYSIG